MTGENADEKAAAGLSWDAALQRAASFKELPWLLLQQLPRAVLPAW